MIRIVIIAMMLLIVSGCKINENKARNYYLDNTDKLAKLSATVFPPTTQYKEGEVIKGKPDTVYGKADTVLIELDCPDGTKVSTKIGGRDTIKIYVPILRVDTISKSDNVGTEHWRNEYNAKDRELIGERVKLEMQKQKSLNRLYWAISVTVLLVISLWMNIKGFFR